MDIKSKAHPLNSAHYSKLLILISQDFNTYEKLRAYRQKAELIKRELAPSVVNIQFKRLKETGYIRDDGIKRRYNRKRFLLDWPKFLELFRTYLNERRGERINQERGQNFRFRRQKMEEEGFPADYIGKISQHNREAYSGSLNNLKSFSSSMEKLLRDFFEGYFRGIVIVEISSLNLTMAQHFDRIIVSLARVGTEYQSSVFDRLNSRLEKAIFKSSKENPNALRQELSKRPYDWGIKNPDLSRLLYLCEVVAYPGVTSMLQMVIVSSLLIDAKLDSFI